jgi:hypothetical protein
MDLDRSASELLPLLWPIERPNYRGAKWLAVICELELTLDSNQTDNRCQQD